MKVSLVLIMFVFNANSLMGLDEKTTLIPSPPLREQISGICTKKSIEKIPQTQLMMVTRRAFQKCQHNKYANCTVTKIIGQTVATKYVIKTKLIEVCCPGYRASGTKCKPICTVPCDNGLCTQPNFCTCYPQYRKISEYHCAPICNDCHHGICIYPDKCKCFANYENNQNGTCVPVCKNTCINSDCTLPNTCSCHEGYILSKVRNNICMPVCNLPCGKGGVCHEPDVCLCARNYRVNETNQCEPVCNACENGVCTDPGVCVCNKNYRPVKNARNETRCESTSIMMTSESMDYDIVPTSESYYDIISDDDFEDSPNPFLEHLTYTSENILHIVSGRLVTSPRPISMPTTPSQVVYINEAVEEKCDMECVNGECQDGHCLCDDGYYESELIPNQCDPICEFHSADGCINGTCVAPHKCECYAEFTAISDHVCIPLVKKTNLAVDHDEIVKHEDVIKNVARQFVQYLVGTLTLLIVVILITFIVYKWYNRRMSYHLYRAEGVQFGAQYIMDDDGCEL